MPMIDFKFTGVIRGADINIVHDKEGNPVNVAHLTSYELAHHLDKGTYTIELGDYINDCVEQEVKAEEFVASRFRPRE
jgi:hypothetical protein